MLGAEVDPNTQATQPVVEDLSVAELENDPRAWGRLYIFQSGKVLGRCSTTITDSI